MFLLPNPDYTNAKSGNKILCVRFQLNQHLSLYMKFNPHYLPGVFLDIEIKRGKRRKHTDVETTVAVVKYPLSFYLATGFTDLIKSSPSPASQWGSDNGNMGVFTHVW